MRSSNGPRFAKAADAIIGMFLNDRVRGRSPRPHWLGPEERLDMHQGTTTLLSEGEYIMVVGSVSGPGLGKDMPYREASIEIDMRKALRSGRDGDVVETFYAGLERLLTKLAPPLPTDEIGLAGMALNSEDGLEVYADKLLASGVIAPEQQPWFIHERDKAVGTRAATLHQATLHARNVLGPHIFDRWTRSWAAVRWPKKWSMEERFIQLQSLREQDLISDAQFLELAEMPDINE